ncbi:protein LONGIFOLIA 2-like [Salvia divinorum]|uniref:Protein LONGIFOLIA 2-like n=1 Tax=Salvia divinorum TaxID=28513 RepID=A0ABD1FJI2_SALDI
MAAKLLHSLTDEYQDLQKGCMTGMFQMFDRQHMLRITTKRLPPRPGSSRISSSDTSQRDSKSSSQDKNYYKNVQDRQRYSIESSRPSFSSSSRSSSFSSLDCNKAAQLEAGPFDRMIFPETPSSDSAMSVQPQYRRHSLDLRDLVKESIYRETHGSSMKAKPTEGAAVPFVSSKTSDGVDKKPADFKESLRILTKLQEAPRYNNEPGALLRSSSLSISRDTTRFSYDGDCSNSSVKLRDLPRLSLDSRENSMRSVGVVQGKVQSRPPSVVAKLMGLDSLPDSVSSGESDVGSTRSYQDESFVDAPSSFEKSDKAKPVQPTSPSRNSWKEPISPRWRNSDGSVKPVAWLPIEPAPWKHNDGTRTSQKPASKSAKAPTVFPSVYSEIEKRLGALEFMQSGKDLRALKQILEAVQVKGLSETAKGLEKSVDQRKLLADKVLAVTKRKVVAAQNHEPPIVVMKPAKFGEKSGISADKRKDSNSGRASKEVVSKSSERESAPSSVGTRNNRTVRSQQLAKEGSAGSGKISGSVGPRLQQKKLEPERRSRPPTPPDSSKSRRQPNKQQAESKSRVGRQKLKNSCPQKSDDQLSKFSVESRDSSSHEIEDSAESNAELNSSERSPGATGFDSSSSKTESGYVPPKYSSPVSVLDNAAYAHDSCSPIKYRGKTLKVNERDSNDVERSSTESFVSSSTESGSSFEYMRERLLNIDNLVQKLRRLNSSHDEARTDYIASLCENENPDHRYISEILLASGLLLRDLGSNLTDFQFHQSGNPINPELFLVLEQTKASASSKNESTVKTTTRSSLATNEKLRRRFIFDTVNETLARKLGPESKPWQSPAKLARRVLNTQNLLKELCCEIEELETRSPVCSSGEEDDRWKAVFCHDLLLQSDNWMDFDADVSGVVLDIERLVFKDLVDEIVRGEAAGSTTKQGTRKLPAK